MLDPTTFYFIKNIIYHTLQINSVYSVYPYDNLEDLDMGLNNSLNNSDILYLQMKQLFEDFEHHHFYLITTRFQTHFIAFFPFECSRDILSLGPYLDETVTNDFIQRLLLINHISLSNVEILRSYFYSLPIISNNMQLASILTDIEHYINPNAPQFHLEYIDFTVHSDKELDYTPKENFYAYAESVARRYDAEAKLLEQIAKGNYTNALKYSQEFLAQRYLTDCFRDHQIALVGANAIFRKTVECNNIHPVYLHNISAKYNQLISEASTHTDLKKLHEKMVREYCLLVVNNSMKEYSPVIQRVLNYLNFNLANNLALTQIAEELGISVSHLTTSFKKEVGESIITYVTKQRVQLALRLLNTSDYSIQEISAQVGILDYNYFTKVFKKQIGCTPSQYRKQITKT